MRLIDADALFKELNDKNIPWNRQKNDIIMAQPTAYNLDVVVEQMKDKERSYRRKQQLLSAHIVEKCIDIVRNGGKE